MNELTLYDENNEKIDVPQSHDDEEFNSRSDDSSDGEYDSDEREPDFAPIFFTEQKRDELIKQENFFTRRKISLFGNRL
jgi:hypothetical protein